MVDGLSLATIFLLVAMMSLIIFMYVQKMVYNENLVLPINLDDVEEYTENRFEEYEQLENCKVFDIFEDIELNIADRFRLFMRKNKNIEIIDIVINTNGGDSASAEIILDLIKKNKKHKFRALIFGQSFSAGTYIALGCDEIYMSYDSVLSPCDVLESKDNSYQVNDIIESKGNDDKLFEIMAQKTKDYDIYCFDKFIKPKYDPETLGKIYDVLFSGKERVHTYIMDKDEVIQKTGIKIKDPNENMILYLDLLTRCNLTD
jgi:ATP-dependent protease ClpP protease subunit